MNRHPHNRHARRAPLVLLALMGLLLAGTAQAQLTDADVEKITAGDQPIRFSHEIHATRNGIDCQYCHVYARRSPVSGVPPVAICAGCHRFVGLQLKEVQKVMTFWNDKEPIPWVKVHDLPDFVRYRHDKHINAENEVYPNGVPCQDCHGPIETMDLVEKFYPSFGKMGWCLACHLKIPGAMERKRAVASTTDPTKLKDYQHPSGDYIRPNLSDCLSCHY